jgi:hypothetical protein
MVAEDRTASEDLVREVEKSYEKEFDHKSELDTNATSMITMSGGIATLFMGFGTILLKDIPRDRLEFLVPASMVLMAEIILIILTIRYSVTAYKIKDYRYFHAMTHEQFIDGDGNLNKENLVNILSLPKDAFNKRMIEDYLVGTVYNLKTNEQKRRKIVFSQRLFNIALLIIPAFAFIIVLYKFL